MDPLTRTGRPAWRWIMAGCLLQTAACAAPSRPADALERLAAGVARWTLDNGMTVLTREAPRAPLVSIQVWVGVGSADEQDRLGAGLSHLVEHLVFKGTPSRGPGEISRQISDLGGTINAYTSVDRTVFLVDLPAPHWRAGLDILADAVLNACFPETEWKREQDVIRREMAMGRDSPDRQLGELLFQTAYTRHPYRVPVIGYEPVFSALTREAFLDYYRRHYAPHAMILALVGPVPEAEVRAAAARAFGGAPRRAAAPVVRPAEPPRLGRRAARRTGDYAVTRLERAWPTVSLTHPDAAALDLLADVVGGGRSARLVRELKEVRRLALDISAWSWTPRDPGLFGISAELEPARETELQAALDEEVARWTALPFPEDELDRARRQILTGLLARLETAHGQAETFAEGELEAGAPDFFLAYLRRLQDVTPTTLLDTARRYLRPETRTDAVLAPDAPREAVPSTAAQDAPRADRPLKTTLPNGVRLLTRPDHTLPLVTLCAACGGGLLTEPGTQPGVSRLMADLLTRGTARRSAQALANAVEARGGTLTSFSGQNSLGLQARCLPSDAALFMDLLSDCLLNPAFPPDELDKQKALQQSALAQRRESPMVLAQDALRQALFPGHPYRYCPDGTEESIRALTPALLRAHHARTVVGGNLVVAIFGDLAPDEADALARRHLARVPAGLPPASEHPAARPAGSRELDQATPHAQAILLRGFPGIALSDPRRDALAVLQKAMSGLASDLMVRVRDEQGLVYYAGAWNQPGLEPGLFALYAGTHTGALDSVRGLFSDELRRLTAEGLRPDEFARAREQLLADQAGLLERSADLALDCALNELYGLGHDYSFNAQTRLEALTLDSIRQAAAEVLDPARAVSVVIRPAAADPSP